MDNSVVEKIRSDEFSEELTLVYSLYKKLKNNDKQTFLNSLNSRHQTAINIIQTLERGVYSYSELAKIVGKSKNTTMQYVYALDGLGYNVIPIDKTALYPVGRKQLVKTLSKSKRQSFKPNFLDK